MTNLGAVLILASLMLLFFVTVTTANRQGKREHEEDCKKIAQADQKELDDRIAKGLGDNIFGDLYHGTARIHRALSNAIPATKPRVRTPDFVACCECPTCKTVGYHYIEDHKGRYVLRQCLESTCQQMWRQRK